MIACPCRRHGPCGYRGVGDLALEFEGSRAPAPAEPRVKIRKGVTNLWRFWKAGRSAARGRPRSARGLRAQLAGVRADSPPGAALGHRQLRIDDVASSNSPTPNSDVPRDRLADAEDVARSSYAARRSRPNLVGYQGGHSSSSPSRRVTRVRTRNTGRSDACAAAARIGSS